MNMTAFPCPACGNKGAYEITSEAEDLRAIEGAICLKCGHVVTQKEFKDWGLNFAAEIGKELSKKSRLGLIKKSRLGLT